MSLGLLELKEGDKWGLKNQNCKRVARLVQRSWWGAALPGTIVCFWNYLNIAHQPVPQ